MLDLELTLYQWNPRPVLAERCRRILAQAVLISLLCHLEGHKLSLVLAERRR